MGGNGQSFPDRAYFYAAAGGAMRDILVENTRRKKRLKRGGDLERVDVANVDLAAPLPDDQLLALDEALTLLAKSEPHAAELVNLCFFVGLTQEQAAKELGISVATVERRWALRARLALPRNPEGPERPKLSFLQLPEGNSRGIAQAFMSEVGAEEAGQSRGKSFIADDVS